MNKRFGELSPSIASSRMNRCISQLFTGQDRGTLATSFSLKSSVRLAWVKVQSATFRGHRRVHDRISDGGQGERPFDLTDPEELRIALDDRWPLAIEVIQALRAEEYQVLYSDSLGDQVLAMLSEFERVQNAAWMSRLPGCIRRRQISMRQSDITRMARRIAACHSVAKWQQTVEKAIKAAGLGPARRGNSRDGVSPPSRGASPSPRAYSIAAIPWTPTNPASLAWCSRSEHANGDSGDRRTRPGASAALEHGVSFPIGQGEWSYPAAEGVFSEEEGRRFRALAHRVLNGAGRIVSAVRQPR